MCTSSDAIAGAGASLSGAAWFSDTSKPSPRALTVAEAIAAPFCWSRFLQRGSGRFGLAKWVTAPATADRQWKERRLNRLSARVGRRLLCGHPTRADEPIRPAHVRQARRHLGVGDGRCQRCMCRLQGEEVVPHGALASAFETPRLLSLDARVEGDAASTVAQPAIESRSTLNLATSSRLKSRRHLRQRYERHRGSASGGLRRAARLAIGYGPRRRSSSPFR